MMAKNILTKIEDDVAKQTEDVKISLVTPKDSIESKKDGRCANCYYV